MEYENIENAREAFHSLKDYKFRSGDRPISIDYDRVILFVYNYLGFT